MDESDAPQSLVEMFFILLMMVEENIPAQTIAPKFTGRFNKVHQYAWSHFSDPDYGEWFGYLNRVGEPLLELKGGKWKGCFHVPRVMDLCYRALQSLKES